MATAAETEYRQHQYPHQRHPSQSALSETSSTSTHLSSFPFPLPASFHHHAAPDPLTLSSRPQSPVTVVVPCSKNTKGLTLKDRTSESVVQPIRRLPPSSIALPSVTHHSSSGNIATLVQGLPRPGPGFKRSFLVDSPTVYEFPQPPVGPMSRPTHWESTAAPTIPGASDTIAPTHHDYDGGHSPEFHRPLSFDSVNRSPAATAAKAKIPDSGDGCPAALQTTSSHPDASTLYDELYHDEDEDPLSDNILDGYNSDSSDNTNANPINHGSVSDRSRKHLPHRLIINPGEVSQNLTASNDVKTPITDKPLPKSPNSRLGSIFGWTSSPTAEPSERTYSPLHSPFDFSKSGSQLDGSPITASESQSSPSSTYEASKAEFSTSDSLDYSESYLATSSARSSEPTEIDEMEDELKAISAELAASIRRELDLEDLVNRLQTEKDNTAATGNKRTSDYYSDSGYSSAKLSEYDQSRDEVEKVQRRSEQEKAQLRLELTTKLQDERARRQKMDEQIRDLSTKASQLDVAAINGADAIGRVKELEATCETLRRKLSEERQAKDNIVDLLSALRTELEDTSNERDNLRDEVVPHLQAQVDGLENQASEHEKLTYESTKMQQELYDLRHENSNLKQFQMGSISEETGTVSAPLSRSNSVGGSRSSLRAQHPPSLLSRSKTVKPSESRDQLSERLKDVEEQRDALHRALKNLLERQEHQNRENQKKIRHLEMERDRLLSSSPQKAGFEKEISYLRAEIIVLRRRAEEALDQKWQIEKGLAGLKMDLDKAEQEVGYLRKLLQEKDILIPPAFARLSSGSDQLTTPVTSQSLLAAYHDLQKAYADSLQRIKNLETGAMSDEKTQTAIQKLEAALSSAVTERDLAQHEAESYKEQLAALKAGEQAYLESEKALADELQESARRVEELALQVQQQLSTNQQLRKRITDTITRGDATQKANAERITSMQAHLRFLEEKLEAAQAASEDRVARHGEELSSLKDSNNEQLIRRRDQSRSARTFPSKSGLSPLFTTPGASTPRLSMTRSGPAMNASEATQVDQLKTRVAELENALMDAEAEMQQVVGRMNTAQSEVLQLQEEREAAIDQTRKLERALQEERFTVFEGRFRDLM
ncbi:hypothetical protein GGS21DRAFT_533556 [Xylaria nigripes]|nr:hypothetical protein GGS21DRAFT_533556 [Xylaria nigripes]